GGDVFPAQTNHGHLDAFRQVLGELVDPTYGKLVSTGNFTHVQALCFFRKSWLHDARHKIDAEDRADDTEWIGDRVSDRRLLVVHDIQRGLQGGSACHRSRVYAERVAQFNGESLAQAE